MALRRLNRELAAWQAQEDANISGGPVAEDDLFNWRCSFTGPAGTPYEGGRFFVDIKIESEYPHKAPSVHLATQVFHPQVDDKGHCCLSLLTAENWSADSTIKDVVIAVQTLLGDPSPNAPFNQEAGQLLAANKAAFEARARADVEKYAK